MAALGVFRVEFLLAAIMAGLGFLVWSCRGLRPTAEQIATQLPPAAVIVGAIGLMLFIPPEIKASDDGPAYLLFSEKLRQLGAAGPEVFSERRLYSLGGQFGLVAAATQTVGLRWLSIYEPGLGLALISAFIWIRDRARPDVAAVRLAMVLGVAVASLLVGARPVANLAPAVLYAALLFGLSEGWLSLSSRKTEADASLRNLVLIALFAAAALTLRPTALPFIALIALAGAASAALHRRWRDIALAALAAIVLLAPALLTSLRDTGTALYPFLGRGGHAPDLYAPVSLAETARTLAGQWRAFALVGLIGAVALALGRKAPPGVGALVAAIVVALILVAWPTGGEQLARYSFPIVFPVLASLLIRIEPPPLRRPAWSGAALAGPVALILGLMSAPSVERIVVAHAPASLSARWSQAAFDPSSAGAWRAAQMRVPKGAVILSVAGSHTASLDLRRNPVVTADQPGTVGPGGGWPGTAVSPRDWLSANGVEYVLLDRAFLAARPATDTPWRRGLAASTALAQTQFAAATTGVIPVVETPDLLIYAVRDLNPPR